MKYKYFLKLQNGLYWLMSKDEIRRLKKFKIADLLQGDPDDVSVKSVKNPPDNRVKNPPKSHREKTPDTLPGTGPGHEKKQKTSVDVSRYFEPKSDKWKRFNKSNYKNRNNNYRRSDPDSYDDGFTDCDLDRALAEEKRIERLKQQYLRMPHLKPTFTPKI